MLGGDSMPPSEKRTVPVRKFLQKATRKLCFLPFNFFTHLGFAQFVLSG